MAVPAIHPRYPVQVEARLDRPLSRWLWLVKPLLAIPHYIVLAFLWLGFALLTVVAFVAILFTGRYPRPIFDFNVGVLRWTWRVSYYSWGALATDRYPPFTLADVPDYPARLSVDYPPRLSRGLVLVKWWLLALPHYLVVAFFVGGGTWLATDRTHHWQWGWGSGGLVGLLVLVCAVLLLFTGRYPQPLFDFILGMNRWSLRVCAYAALMTDAYPPFRLDLGGDEPEGLLTLPPPTMPPGGPARGSADFPGRGPAGGPVGGPPGGAAEAGPLPPRPWTTGRIVSVVSGSLVALLAGGLLVGGAGAVWADLTQRDADGYLVSPTVQLDSGGYAVRTESVRFTAAGPSWLRPDTMVGTVRIRVTGADPARPIFVGIASGSAATAYLSGVDHATMTGVSSGRATYALHPGSAPAVPAPQAGIWAAQASGSGPVTLTWKVRSGSWSVLVANADGRRGVLASTDIGATVPALGPVAGGLLIAGLLVLAAGAALIAVPIARAGAGARRPSRAPMPTPAEPPMPTPAEPPQPPMAEPTMAEPPLPRTAQPPQSLTSEPPTPRPPTAEPPAPPS